MGSFEQQRQSTNNIFFCSNQKGVEGEKKRSRVEVWQM